jgi:transketolase
MTGDGELNEGSNWEAIMFASHHKLNNIVLIIDNNRASMLNFSKDIIDMNSLEDKFLAFGWNVINITDGHNIELLYQNLYNISSSFPTVCIVNTIKGKGINFLEKSPLSHILSIKPDEIDRYIEEIINE